MSNISASATQVTAQLVVFADKRGTTRVHDHLLRHFQLETSRARMGEHASGWATKAVMTLLVLAALYLTWQNARVLLAGGP